eukprot:8256250-Karenia_brevis.AAC.1
MGLSPLSPLINCSRATEPRGGKPTFLGPGTFAPAMFSSSESTRVGCLAIVESSASVGGGGFSKGSLDLGNCPLLEDSWTAEAPGKDNSSLRFGVGLRLPGSEWI